MKVEYTTTMGSADGGVLDSLYEFPSGSDGGCFGGVFRQPSYCRSGVHRLEHAIGHNSLGSHQIHIIVPRLGQGTGTQCHEHVRQVLDALIRPGRGSWGIGDPSSQDAKFKLNSEPKSFGALRPAPGSILLVHSVQTCLQFPLHIG
jgi:hypothetical protein